MSLGFYTDVLMSKPINLAKLKRFCLPLSGGSRNSVVYLGDPYYTILASAAAANDTTIQVTDTSEFLPAGSAIVNGTTFTYTGVTTSSLVGCSGMPAANVGSKVTPAKIYKSAGNIVITPSGAGFNNQFTVQLSTNYPTIGFGFGQNPAIYLQTSIQVGSALPLYIQVTTVPGPTLEVSNWTLITSGFSAQNITDTSTPAANIGLQTAVMYGYLFRGLQSPNLDQRVIQLNRQITNLNPGFIVGNYRWRTETTTNGFAFIPPNWNLNPVAIGVNKFQSGIGYAEDLEMVDLVNQNTSIYPVLNSGQYFYGPFRNYLPISTQIEYLNGSGLTHTLLQTPTPQTPIQVGIWTLDNSYTYLPFLTYTYVATALNTDGSSRTDLPVNYFTLNRATNVLTLNSRPSETTAFVGNLNQTLNTFNLPYYPITSIDAAYCDYGGAKPRVYATNYSIDPVGRTVTVNIPGALPGDAVFIQFPAQIAVIYDVGVKGQTRTETSIDLNPAYSGISSGIYYIEQRLRETESIELTCDKPIIDVPATFSSVIDLIAYGPVYQNNDFALLTAQAFTIVPGEIMPNAVLKVIPGPGFSGQINYLDPTAVTIEVTTGGDGKANLVYTPQGNGGYYIPNVAPSGSLAGKATTTFTGDTLVLPAGIPISQIWDPSDGWLVYTYSVYNDKPFYGQVGANLALGEIPYVTTGTSGTAGWTSNGMIVAWQNGTDLVYPINAFDTNNNSYTSNSFNGQVIKLVFAASLPTASDIPAYYINYLQRVTIQLQDVLTGVYSNTILLQMQYPTVIQDNPWLYLNDAAEGIINTFRLGWISPGV